MGKNIYIWFQSSTVGNTLEGRTNILWSPTNGDWERRKRFILDTNSRKFQLHLAGKTVPLSDFVWFDILYPIALYVFWESLYLDNAHSYTHMHKDRWGVRICRQLGHSNNSHSSQPCNMPGTVPCVLYTSYTLQKSYKTKFTYEDSQAQRACDFFWFHMSSLWQSCH